MPEVQDDIAILDPKPVVSRKISECSECRGKIELETTSLSSILPVVNAQLDVKLRLEDFIRHGYGDEMLLR